jgi:hypothetical protein
LESFERRKAPQKALQKSSKCTQKKLNFEVKKAPGKSSLISPKKTINQK